MRMPSAKLLLSVASLAVVLVLFAMDTRRNSPGELSPVHARVAELSGSEGCDACHGGIAQSMRSACLDCHALIAKSLDEKRGLHGTLEASDCARCHLEHHGADLEIAGVRAFALAGIDDPKHYDHAALGFTLAGAHAKLDCAKCHAFADVDVPQAGKPRFSGLSQDCASCHKDPHEGRMQRACVDCHGQSEPFLEVAAFDHGEVFQSTGAHARAACVDCHAKDGPNSVEELGSRSTPRAARTCEQCHDSPHAASFVAGIAAQLPANSASTCGACHDPAGGPFEKAKPPLAGNWHAASGFALSAPHAQQACDACHARSVPGVLDASSTTSFAQRYPGRSADACANCHADPHAGQFSDARLPAQDCLACHTREAFVPSKIDLAAHSQTAFALQGAHARTSCKQCHVSDPSLLGAALRFVDTPTACADCHEDPHADQFRDDPLAKQGCVGCHGFESFKPSSFDQQRHARTDFALDGAHASADCSACHRKDPALPAASARFAGTQTACSACHIDAHDGRFSRPQLLADFPALIERSCAACHDTQSFDHGARDNFDHARLASFELEGAHARADCEQCHAPSALPDAAGRRFGRAAERFPGTVGECATCHADVHAGMFGTPRADVSSPQATCDRCHDSERFDSAQARAFDHGQWTRFELQGAHARMECQKCHAALPTTSADGRSFARVQQLFRGAYDRCDTCHVDPHGGHFDRPGTPLAIAGAVSCARCHTQDSFGGADSTHFDHGVWTGFALSGAHEQTACVACHTPGKQAQAGGRSLGRVSGSACQDCHSDPHAGQFQDRGPSGCVECHDPARAFTEVSFAHERGSRFALDAKHAKLACAACHVSQSLPSGLKAVRYKPLGTQCVDCHGIAGTGRGTGKGG